ncbi:MAG: hypothetical protein ACLQU4_00615 [Limisphaerales bacterium]
MDTITEGRRGRKPGSRTQFKGISADAKALGVTVSYLWRVRTGRMVSRSLTIRDAKLKSQTPMTELQPPTTP